MGDNTVTLYVFQSLFDIDVVFSIKHITILFLSFFTYIPYVEIKS